VNDADDLPLRQLTSQPHQPFLHSVSENFHGNSTPVVTQHHVACGGDSTVGPRHGGLDAGILPNPTLPPLDQGIAQGDIHRYEILEWYR
jgi:hypothetical protein